MMSLILGVIGLYLGAEFLIKGGASFALRLGLPAVVVGLTIMGFGTSTPELIVSVQASLEGKGDIALGNVVGSNIANTGLILGFIALCRPIPIHRQLVSRDTPIMIGTAILFCLLMALNESVSRWKGIVLILSLFYYTFWAIYHSSKLEEKKPPTLKSVWIELLLIFIGFLFLFAGGKMFLDGAITIARKFAMSEAVIGLTIVALGTSLPEFATSLVALYKKQEDFALGNIIGSNIFNILGIVGASAAIRPLHVSGISWIDYGYMTALLAVLWLIIREGAAITRWEGAMLLFSYCIYLYYLVWWL